MLCVCPPINVSNSATERSDFGDSEETESTLDTARLTVHEDEVELYWPLAYSTCYPVWQAACISNAPFYPYPLVCPIEEANVVFKNMMFGAQELPSHILAMDGFIPNSIEHEKAFASSQKLKFWADPNFVAQRELALLAATVFGEDTRRSSELTTPIAFERKGGSKAQVHIPKDEMVLASKSLMELDATCDKRVSAQLQGIGRKRGTKVIERVKTKLSLLMNFERKIRKKRPVVEKVKSESTESFTEGLVQDGYFSDDEMNSALLLLEHQFGSSNRAALRVAEALNRGKVALRKLKAYLGEEGASNFLRTITKPHWLMTLLSNALGSMRSALNCVDVYRTSEIGSSAYKEAAGRLIEVAGNENFVKAFVQKFSALRDSVANSLSAQLKMSADEVDQIILGCLGGANIPMRRIEGLTGAKAEIIQGLLNALKRCNEEEVEMYMQILIDCTEGKLKSDEETAERLARIKKHETELEYQIQKHQQGLEEHRYRRKSSIMITMPTREQPLYTIDVSPPEIIPTRQEKPKSKKKGVKVATATEKVKKDAVKEKKKVALVMAVAETKEADEESEELWIGNEEITIPFLDFTALDESSGQSTLSGEIPQQSQSFTAGSVLSMEGVDLEEDMALRDQQSLDEPSQLSARKVAKLGSSEGIAGMDEFLELPSETYIVNETPGDISDILLQEDMRLIDTRLSERVWDLKKAVGCEGFLEPDIGLEPNRIVLVLARSAISAKANQLIEMLAQVQTLLKHFQILESVKNSVRYMWDLLFQKIATKLRNGDYGTNEKTIYLDVGRRIIKQLKQLGVKTYRYVSHLEASVMRKSMTDSMVRTQDLLPETPVVPNVDLGELLDSTRQISRKGFSSFGQVTPTIHFSLKEALEETESTYSMAAPSSVGEKKEASPSSSTTSVAISGDLPLTEKQPTITEGQISAELSDSEVMWLPSTSRGMMSTSTAAEGQFMDFESFDEAPEDMLKRGLYEAYGGEAQGTRASLIRMVQEMVENPTVFDVAELRSSKSFDLDNVDEMQLELAVAKVIQKMEDEEAAARLTRVATPEVEEAETLEMRLARARALIAQRRPRATEEESPKEIRDVSLTPPLPPYHADVVKYQLLSIVEELETSQSNQQGLNTLERILWLTLPENVADRYELFVRVADLQRRGQFSGEALKALLESVLMDVTDLMTLLDPDFEIEDEQRYNIYDQLRTNLDVLRWFKVDIEEYEEQLQEYPELMQFGGTLFPRKFEHPFLLKNAETKLYLPQSYLHYIPQSVAKVVDTETPQPWHMVTLQGIGADTKLSFDDSEEESAEMLDEPVHDAVQIAPLADSLTEEIKERMYEAIFEKTFRNELVPIYKKFREIGQMEHSKQLALLKENLEGELFKELPPTQKQANILAAYMKWRKKKLEMAGTTARCLFSIAPEIVNQDKDIFLAVIKLVDVQALSGEVATLFVSSTLQDLLDLTLIALNKDDFQKNERQMAYNQCRAMLEVLQCFNVPIKEFKSNFDYCTDLEDQYEAIFEDGKFPTIGNDCEFFADLPQACIQELPFEVLEAIGGRLRVEETERESLKSYLKHIDAQAFVDQDEYDFERTRALAVHSLRLHPQDVNGIVRHEIEVLEEQKRRMQEESRAREGAATDIERIIDRWLGFQASADRRTSTSSPEMAGVSEAALALEATTKKESGKSKKHKVVITTPKRLAKEGLPGTPIDRDETMEEISSIETSKQRPEESEKPARPMAPPSAEVLPQEGELEGGQPKEAAPAVHSPPEEGATIHDGDAVVLSADQETGKPLMKKLYTSPTTPQQQLEDIAEEPSQAPFGSTMLSEGTDSLSVFELSDFLSTPVIEVEKDIIKLLEKNTELEIQREKFARHLAAVEAAKKTLSVIYERLGDVSATAKRKAYDQTSRLRQEEEHLSRKKLQLQEGGEKVTTATRSAHIKESLKIVSRISTKKRRHKKRRTTVESVSSEQPSLTPSIHLPPLELKMVAMMSKNLPPAVHKFPEIESVYSVSPLSPPPPSPPPSGRTKLPPLWSERQRRWRNIFLQESGADETSVPKVEVITPIDMTLKNIQPLKLVRARKHYVDERASYVARVAEPTGTMISETLTAISVEERLPKRVSHWFNRISRKETMRRRNVIPPPPSRIAWQKVPDVQAVIRFPRPSTTASEKRSSVVVDEQLRKSPWAENTHMEANHRLITNELRTNLILKKLRMQLDTHDLVEVMIDLHTGRASKKTREIVEAAYEAIRDQKYTHLLDEAAEKCRPQCRPNDVSSAEWKRLGADLRSAHPFDEHSFPGYFIADGIGSSEPAHCEQEKMARLGAFSNDLTFGRVSRRANIIGRVRTYVQERSYTRIKKSLEDCIQVFNSRIKNEELH